MNFLHSTSTATMGKKMMISDTLLENQSNETSLIKLSYFFFQIPEITPVPTTGNTV